jgi:hypothetical protein
MLVWLLIPELFFRLFRHGVLISFEGKVMLWGII